MNRPAKKTRQYTIRAVPAHVDKALRAKADGAGRSLNDVALEALQRGLGLDADVQRHHDLDFCIGTWVEDSAFDEALRDFEQIDSELWK